MAGKDPEREARRLKSQAEAEFKSSKNLKSALKHAKAALRLFPSLPGLSEMITCFNILAAGSSSSGMPDYYGILQVEPFSNANMVRKQYKSLALAIHPDKNPSLGAEEAFKVVGDAFRVLTDRIRRKEYDMKLRIRMQEEAARGEGLEVNVERFWAACSRCRILHQFEKKYLGHNLVCPSCGKSFRAVEIGDNDKDDDDDYEEEEDEDELSESEAGNAKLKRKSISISESVAKRRVGRVDNSNRGTVKSERGSLKKRESRSRMTRVMDEIEKPSYKNKTTVEEETMTLAEMQLEATRKMNRKKSMLREKEKEKGLEEGVAERPSRMISASDAENRRSTAGLATMRCSDSEKTQPLQVYSRRTWRKNSLADRGTDGAGKSKNQNAEFMLVEDSDFYDFDKDRSEKRFKKGQVWAAYDKVDVMPRKYCLIDEVSPSPFTLRVSCLDLQDNVRHPQAKTSCALACGRFKVAQKTTLKSVKLLSHVVDCERAARELYWIYPKKGSVWVLFKNKFSYEIVVSLTSYSEVFGLSMAYLKRVDGYKTVFRRREMGPHGIHWLDKSELGALSHQIPARKLDGSDVPNLLKDCWELDPVSLPPDLLTIPVKK